jgi:hypothetical protein
MFAIEDIPEKSEDTKVEGVSKDGAVREKIVGSGWDRDGDAEVREAKESRDRKQVDELMRKYEEHEKENEDDSDDDSRGD